MHFGNGRRPYRLQSQQSPPERSRARSPFALYLRQGRVPSFVRHDDPPALADELAALRRWRAMV